MDPDDRVEMADRARWRAQLATTRAGGACGCGMCPARVTPRFRTPLERELSG